MILHCFLSSPAPNTSMSSAITSTPFNPSSAMWSLLWYSFGLELNMNSSSFQQYGTRGVGSRSSYQPYSYFILFTDQQGSSGRSMLGPILSLAYIYDLSNQIDCNISLFADDTLIYHVVNNTQGKSRFQNKVYANSGACPSTLINVRFFFSIRRQLFLMAWWVCD